MDIRKTILVFVLCVYLPQLSTGESVPECLTKIKSDSYLDVALKMIKKTKNKKILCPKMESEALDCAEILRNGHTISGVYNVFPKNRLLGGKRVKVLCDMDTVGGGWTLIQRRGNFNNPGNYFFQDWYAYKKGFGDVEKEFWLGNDNIFALTNQKLYSIRFDLTDVEGNKRYAQYDTFWIDDEDHKYTSHIKGYRGDAGDSMIADHDNKGFSTKDNDNDEANQNCAEVYKGGWWYGACHRGLASNLNALYQPGQHDSFGDGMIWYHWKGHYESMALTEIKIRPKSFRKATLSSYIVIPR